jgi:hypothetical protein
VVLPAKGTTMKAVQKQFGEPRGKRGPVGGDSPRHPPITRWDYDGFVVIFEKDRVIDAVVPGAPPRLHTTAGLTRATDAPPPPDLPPPPQPDQPPPPDQPQGEASQMMGTPAEPEPEAEAIIPEAPVEQAPPMEPTAEAAPMAPEAPPAEAAPVQVAPEPVAPAPQPAPQPAPDPYSDDAPPTPK